MIYCSCLCIMPLHNFYCILAVSTHGECALKCHRTADCYSAIFYNYNKTCLLLDDVFVYQKDPGSSVDLMQIPCSSNLSSTNEVLTFCLQLLCRIQQPEEMM